MSVEQPDPDGPVTDGDETQRRDAGSQRDSSEGGRSRGAFRELTEVVLEGIPVSEDVEQTVQSRLEMVIGRFTSPVPPPFIMREYGDVLDSMPERILQMAEKQMDHRHSLEDQVVKGDGRRALLGQIMAFVIALAFGFWAYSLIQGGAELAGSFLAAIDLVALVSVFIYGSRTDARGDEDDVS